MKETENRKEEERPADTVVPYFCVEIASATVDLTASQKPVVGG